MLTRSALTPFGMSALGVGMWEDVPHLGRVRGDATMARIFGLTEAEAAQGVSWEQLSALFHPEDLARDQIQRRRVRDEGGLFAWEHRIVPAPGLVRWVLARGRFERRADGLVYGRGIVIDITDSRTEGPFEPPAGFLGAPAEQGSVVEQMADGAMRLWERLGDLGLDEAKRVQPLLEALLYELGRQIAASLSGPPPDGQGRPRNPKAH
ncbi:MULTISPECIES: PAS domain-containing protein [unclassified Methylobacterium]|uniref:PAS domain-containing protein n=1 Tax=Methylobacterium TaxID=407 RepID=UPI001FCDF847|nr:MULTISPECIES: PAS domain-containing protein [unclassified Methylobacterium]MDH3029019.1 PAS domain-containing protein [Methylobacterium fujisawaense]WFS05950.1 PAS domain-containing protein [Methylobacterium sp. 391_Methyba4]